MKLSYFGEQLWIARIEKVTQQMDFVAVEFAPSIRRPAMNSMPRVWQATAMRAQPSTVSWSVSAMADQSRLRAALGQFLGRKGAVGEQRVQMKVGKAGADVWSKAMAGREFI